MEYPNEVSIESHYLLRLLAFIHPYHNRHITPAWEQCSRLCKFDIEMWPVMSYIRFIGPDNFSEFDFTYFNLKEVSLNLWYPYDEYRHTDRNLHICELLQIDIGERVPLLMKLVLHHIQRCDVLQDPFHVAAEIR